MKNSLLLSIIFSALTFISIAQTKPTTTTRPTTTKSATTTTKPVPAKPKSTTTVKKAPIKTATKTTIAKPVTTAPVAKPIEPPKEAIAPPAEVVKEPTGPPVTGPLGDGPKSYSAEPATKGKTIGNTAKPARTVAAKSEKVNRNSAKEAVRSYIGIRGGYNLSTSQDVLKELEAGIGSSDAQEKLLPGYMGGVVINLGLSKVFSIQPEFIYSQQGLKIENGTDKIIGKYDIVNVPLLLKLAFGSPKVKFFINAGPYIGYKLNQSIDIKWLGFEEKGKQEFVTEYDATTGIKDNRFDFGGIGGAGFQFNIGGPLLILEGRYQYGMADPSLYKDGKPESMGSIGHTRVITGTVGLLFPLGGK